MQKPNLHIASLLILLLFVPPASAATVYDSAEQDAHKRRMLEIIAHRTRTEWGPKYDLLDENRKKRLLQEERLRYLERIRSAQRLLNVRNGPMTFYGQVADSYGRPVPNAVLTVEVESENYVGEEFPVRQVCLREEPAVSGADGKFVLDGLYGWRLRLKYIEAEGYWYLPENQPALVFYPLRHPSNLKSPYFFRQNPKLPVVFRLEQMMEPAD